MELKEDKNRIRLVVGWIVDIAVVISIAWFAVFAMGTQIRVSGQSMEPVLSRERKGSDEPPELPRDAPKAL